MAVTNEDIIKDWSDSVHVVIKKFTDEGDFYRHHIINPTIFSLLGEIKGKKILDAGSGQGYLCRMLAKKGAQVTGVEPSKLIDYAIEREAKENLGITYLQEDLSVWTGMSASFDVIISNMVFMDIPDWKPAVLNYVQVLKKRGTFLISISHPCFDEQESLGDRSYAKVVDYFTEYEIQNPIGYSFHRTLSTYINFLIENGCVIKKIAEPGVLEDISSEHEKDKNVPNFLFIKTIKTK